MPDNEPDERVAVERDGRRAWAQSRRTFLRVAIGAALLEASAACWLRDGAEPGPRFLAKDYGVTGDGTTDDTAALQRAVNAAAGGVLELPAGVYRLTAMVALPSNLTVIGATNDSTILTDSKYLGASARKNIKLKGLKFRLSTGALQFVTCENCEVSNCSFDGKATDPTWYLSAMAVRFNGCRNISVIDSVFADYNNAVYFDKDAFRNCDGALVRGCRFVHSGQGAKFSYPAQVYQYNCDDLTVDACTFVDILPGETGVAGRQAYAVYEGDGTARSTVVTNCKDTVTTAKRAGLHTGVLTSMNRTTFISATVFDYMSSSSGMAFQSGGTETVSFTKNTCVGAAFLAAPSAARCKVTVENNTFEHLSLGTTPAVRIGADGRKAARATIHANKIDDVQGGGVLINYCDYATVSDNEITNANTVNTTQPGDDTWEVSGVAFFGATNGIATRNHIANTTTNSGHAHFGITTSTQSAGVDVRSDNVFVGMEKQAVWRRP